MPCCLPFSYMKEDIFNVYFCMNQKIYVTGSNGSLVHGEFINENVHYQKLLIKSDICDYSGEVVSKTTFFSDPNVTGFLDYIPAYLYIEVDKEENSESESGIGESNEESSEEISTSDEESSIIESDNKNENSSIVVIMKDDQNFNFELLSVANFVISSSLLLLILLAIVKKINKGK